MLVFTVYIRGARSLHECPSSEPYLCFRHNFVECRFDFLSCRRRPSSVFFLTAFAIRLKCSVVSFTLRWILPVFFQTSSLLSSQLTDGSVGLTENVEGESRRFMVWLGTSVTSALLLHTFEVRS